jgi:hypothetical protein
MLAQDPSLKPFSRYSSFSRITINLGPRTVTLLHRDSENLVFGLCIVVVLGRYNPKTGGHLVLHNAKLIYEVGLGDIVFFQSGGITHQNLNIGLDETRQSLVLFSAGQLFAFRDQGFQTQKQLQRDNIEAFYELREHDAFCWEDGINMYSTMEELSEMWGSGKGK